MNRSRWVLHVDMDAFYASIEQRDFPEYQGKPVIVGADPKGGRGRGVVSAASYEARHLGIHSAQPISQAYRLCPQGIFLRPRMERYVEVSERIQAILREFTPLVEPISLDEAFLDLTGTERIWGDVVSVGRRIKERIREAESLTASVGIGPNKRVAKIASDYGKPDGFVVVGPDEVQRFLDPLPVGRLWGVGKETEKALRAMGVETVAQLRRFSEEQLVQRFGKAGSDLWRASRGIDESPVLSEREIQSMSQEHTFDEDIDDPERLRQTLLVLSEKVGFRVRQAGRVGKAVTLKVRFEGFETYTRNKTLADPICADQAIFRVALQLFEAVPFQGRKVRLLGIGLSHLIPQEWVTESLFEEEAARYERISRAMDALKDRYGPTVIGHAGGFQRPHRKK